VPTAYNSRKLEGNRLASQPKNYGLDAVAYHAGIQDIFQH